MDYTDWRNVLPRYDPATERATRRAAENGPSEESRPTCPTCGAVLGQPTRRAKNVAPTPEED